MNIQVLFLVAVRTNESEVAQFFNPRSLAGVPSASVKVLTRNVVVRAVSGANLPHAPCAIPDAVLGHGFDRLCQKHDTNPHIPGSSPP